MPFFSFAYGEEGIKMSKENSLITNVEGGAAVLYEVELVKILKGAMDHLHPRHKVEEEHDDDLLDDRGRKARGFKINSPRGSKHRNANLARTNHPKAEKARREAFLPTPSMRTWAAREPSREPRARRLPGTGGGGRRGGTHSSRRPRRAGWPGRSWG